MTALSRRFSAHMPIIARVLPFAVFIAFLVIADIASWLAPSAEASTPSPWLAVARGLVVAAIVVAFLRHYSELADFRGVGFRRWLAAIVVGLLVFFAWIALDHPLFGSGDGAGGFVPLRPDGSLNVSLVALRLIGLVIVVPVMEEIFWRSFLLRWLTNPSFLALDPARVDAKAFVITAALFAFAHELWLAGLVAGFAYNALYVRARTIWVPIAAHAVTNGVLGAYILWRGAWHLW